MRHRRLVCLLLLAVLPAGASSFVVQSAARPSTKVQPNTAGTSSKSEGKHPDQTVTKPQTATQASSSSTSGSETSKGQEKPAAAALVVSPPALDFANVEVGAQSAPQYVTVSNNTNGNLPVGHVGITGNFALSPTPLPTELGPGQSLFLAIRFAPKQDAAASGTLTITPDKGNALQVKLTGSTLGVTTRLCSIPHRREFWFMLCLALAYWLAMVTVRWHRVAKPTRELLRAEIASMRADLDMLPDTPDPPQPGAPPAEMGWRREIGTLLEDASRLMSPRATGKGWRSRAANFLLWSRGDEMTGWGYVYEADIKMAAHLPIETAVAQLEIAQAQLAAANSPPCTVLGASIKEALGHTPRDPQRLRALLAEANNSLHDQEERSFSDLVSWQNKASWLVGCGLALILVLTIAISQHAILFVVGAAGGLLSRMSRSLNRKDVPTDYGASWSTLFLSPVAGALGGWTGILLADLATELKILGPVFNADFTMPCNHRTLAVALVFGVSERLLDGVLDKLDEHTQASSTSKPQSQSPPITTAAQTAAGPKVTDKKLKNAKVGQPYSEQLEAAGVSGKATWSTSDTLPQGLKLNPDGSISGQAAGPAITASFTVEVKDAANKSDTHKFILVVTN